MILPPTRIKQIFKNSKALHSIEYEKYVLQSTRDWVENFIVKSRICPFAIPVWKSNDISFQLATSNTKTKFKTELLERARYFIKNEQIQTELFIVPFVPVFADFLVFAKVVQEVASEKDVAQNIQIVSFHPDWYSELPKDSMTNYTNRTPFPTCHLLREKHVTEVVEKFGGEYAESVVERNKKFLSTSTEERADYIKNLSKSKMTLPEE
eukprot:TRINITY_DN9823_c0_g1_i1.p1 TRINITY_DN9823_c0_g1~~TRINITY_DN9823_c0_g1_i1.p1  ORF type:complete len:209 (-),score=28.77 TRINITY_DN9823_c0_g1_i1:314-940(-)